jgi:hypothetical protein
MNTPTQTVEFVLHTIVTNNDLNMNIRVAALQQLEDMEMGLDGEVMTEKDVREYTQSYR